MSDLMSFKKNMEQLNMPFPSDPSFVGLQPNIPKANYLAEGDFIIITGKGSNNTGSYSYLNNGSTITKSYTLSSGATVNIGPFIGRVKVSFLGTSGSIDATVGDAVLGIAATAAAALGSSRPSTAVISCIPCDDIKSRFADVSGNGCDLLPDRLNTAAFASEGIARTAVGTANNAAGLVIPPEKLSVNFSKSYLIFSIEVNAASPAANGHLLSFSSVVGGGLGYTGFYIDWQTNGTVQPVFTFDGVLKNNALTLPTDAAFPFFESTPKKRRLTIAIDPDGSMFIFRDRRLVGRYPNIFVGATAFPNVASGKRLRLGGWADDAAVTVACDFSNVHIITGPGHLPVSIGTILRRMMQMPKEPVPQASIRTAVHRSWWFGIAQSNFAGPGGGANYYVTNDGDGCPMVEPCLIGTGPTKVSGSCTSHPTLAGMLGKCDAWWGLDNTGIGSTSLSTTWVGYGRDYAMNMVASIGAYVYEGGVVYKLISTDLTANPVNSSFVLTSAPSAGTPPANCAWTNMGARSVFEVDKYIYFPTDGTGRFDPNALISTAATRILTYLGMDVRGAIIEIGQGDVSGQISRANFSRAIQSVAAYLSPLGMYTMVAMPITGPGSDAWYQSNLLPGRLDALAALAGNPLVKEGPNLAALGVYGGETANQATGGAAGVPFEPTPKLQNNAGTIIHANGALQLVAAAQYAAAFAAAFNL